MDHSAPHGRVFTMDITRKLMVGLAGLLVLAATTALTGGAGAQGSSPSMTVTPQSGVQPLSVTVAGSNCAATLSTTGAYQIRVSWQAEDEPATGQIRLIADGTAGAAWSTTLELSAPNLGVNIISAICLDGSGQDVFDYPVQQVEVLPEPPELVASPTQVSPGDSVTATADQCPDPDGPILGGAYCKVGLP